MPRHNATISGAAFASPVKELISTVIAIKNIKPFYKRAALSLCTAATLFFLVPLYVVYLSKDDINFNIQDFFFSSLLITLACSIFLFACASVLALFRLSWLASLALYFLMLWTSFSGYMLPLVEQAGMKAPEDLLTNSQNLSIVAGASLLLALLTFTRLKSAIQVFLLILTVSTLYSALPPLLASTASLSRFSSLSTSDNLLVLSFDGLAGNVAKQVLEEDPELKQQLKDFIFFDNAISAAPATWASIRYELYGNINFKDFKDADGKPLLLPPGRSNYLQHEQDDGSDVVTYGAYSTFNWQPGDRITPLTLGGNTLSERAATALILYPHIAARIGTALTARFVSQEIGNLVSAATLSPTSQRTLEHKGAKWDALDTLHSEDLVTFTDNLHLENGKRHVRYLHLLHTHFPVDLDENCNYRSADAQWYADNQTYEGVLKETHCALRQTARLITKLKALGVYDKTLFVVKSDHGAPVSYMTTEPDNFMINDHPQWGYNRYRPLLMIKTRSHESETLTYNSMLASLSDLARTLCLQTPAKHSCDSFAGLDILETKPAGIFIDVVKDANSGFMPDTHTTIEIPRDPDFTAALRSTGAVDLTNEMTLFNQRKRDLEQVRDALNAYYQVHGRYPPSESFDGLHSIWGKDTAQWINGLAPEFIPVLPLDPAHSKESVPQYIYLSDGNNYKLLAHGPTQSWAYAKSLNPELVDPVRDGWGFGYWSEGARNW